MGIEFQVDRVFFPFSTLKMLICYGPLFFFLGCLYDFHFITGFEHLDFDVLCCSFLYVLKKLFLKLTN